MITAQPDASSIHLDRVQTVQVTALNRQAIASVSSHLRLLDACPKCVRGRRGRGTEPSESCQKFGARIDGTCRLPPALRLLYLQVY